MKHRWQRVPSKIRRPLVMTLGALLIILAGLIGWLPGPGGTVIFLLGVAVLATEFEWAERLRDYLLGLVKTIGHYIRRHPVLSVIAFIIIVGAFCLILYAVYGRLLAGI